MPPPDAYSDFLPRPHSRSSTAQLIGEQSRNGVDAAAGRKPDDQPHGARRERVLGLRCHRRHTAPRCRSTNRPAAGVIRPRRAVDSGLRTRRICALLVVHGLPLPGAAKPPPRGVACLDLCVFDARHQSQRACHAKEQARARHPHGIFRVSAIRYTACKGRYRGAMMRATVTLYPDMQALMSGHSQTPENCARASPPTVSTARRIAPSCAAWGSTTKPSPSRSSAS